MLGNPPGGALCAETPKGTKALSLHKRPRNQKTNNNKPKHNMAEQVLRDRNGNKIGSIETQSSGVQIARDRSGNKVGEYDPRSNVTRDRNGNKIGEGNQLAALIH